MGRINRRAPRESSFPRAGGPTGERDYSSLETIPSRYWFRTCWRLRRRRDHARNPLCFARFRVECQKFTSANVFRVSPVFLDRSKCVCTRVRRGRRSKRLFRGSFSFVHAYRYTDRSHRDPRARKHGHRKKDVKTGTHYDS